MEKMQFVWPACVVDYYRTSLDTVHYHSAKAGTKVGLDSTLRSCVYAVAPSNSYLPT